MIQLPADGHGSFEPGAGATQRHLANITPLILVALPVAHSTEDGMVGWIPCSFGFCLRYLDINLLKIVKGFHSQALPGKAGMSALLCRSWRAS